MNKYGTPPHELDDLPEAERKAFWKQCCQRANRLTSWRGVLLQAIGMLFILPVYKDAARWLSLRFVHLPWLISESGGSVAAMTVAALYWKFVIRPRAVGVMWRLRENLCSFCGYDMRATPHRCPECGTAPTPLKYKMAGLDCTVVERFRKEYAGKNDAWLLRKANSSVDSSEGRTAALEILDQRAVARGHA